MSKITAYNGNKHFIFISYAHKDSALVYPIIEELQKSNEKIMKTNDAQNKKIELINNRINK